jgi:hypothetical protein
MLRAARTEEIRKKTDGMEKRELDSSGPACLEGMLFLLNIRTRGKSGPKKLPEGRLKIAFPSLGARAWKHGTLGTYPKRSDKVFQDILIFSKY